MKILNAKTDNLKNREILNFRIKIIQKTESQNLYYDRFLRQ